MTTGNSKVLGVGLGKTGTKTLGTCMQTLGYHHRSFDFELVKLLVIGEGEEEMNRLMGEYDSFEDTPWCLLYREMDERYPDARYVLTTRRDSETWFESLRAHCLRNPLRAARYLFGTDDPVADPAATIARYERHNQDVRDYFAGRPGKLLEVCWENGDGWERLCEFLEREVPDGPFPHVNFRPRKPLRWKTKRLFRRYRKGLARRLGM